MLRVPAFRAENPPLDGAKMVTVFEALRSFSIGVMTSVLVRRRMKTLNPPALSRISVTLVGCALLLDLAAGGAWTSG